MQYCSIVLYCYSPTLRPSSTNGMLTCHPCSYNLVQTVLSLSFFVDVLADKHIKYVGQMANVAGYEQVCSVSNPSSPLMHACAGCRLPCHAMGAQPTLQGPKRKPSTRAPSLLFPAGCSRAAVHHLCPQHRLPLLHGAGGGRDQTEAGKLGPSEGGLPTWAVHGGR